MIVLPKRENSLRLDMKSSMSKSLEFFLSGIKTKATRTTYMASISDFRAYFNIKSFDSLLEIKPDEVRKMVEQIVIRDKNRGLSKSHINGKICAIKLFYVMNDIEIQTLRAKKMLPSAKKLTGGKPYSTELLQQVVKALNTKFSLPLKCVVLIMASCGSRVGFTEYLKLKHIGEFEKNGCKSILIYGGEKEEYYSFINPETVKVVDEWIEYRKSKGEIITKDSWVIPKAQDHTKPSDQKAIQPRIVKKLEHIDRGEKVGGRSEIAITHGIRKRWKTIAENTDGVNSSKVEKMFGHSTSNVLDNTYYKPDFANLFKEYEKFSDELVVSQEARLESELLRKDKIIEENQAQKDDKIKELEERIARFEKFIKI